MARLVVNPRSPAPWEIQLKPGANFIGRGFANDFKIPDPSVSGSHCQIVLSDHSAVLKDLGSTNGTFVNRAPVREVALQTGQTVHLGSVEMVFYSDTAAPVVVAAAAPAPMRAALPATRVVGAPAVPVARPATVAIASAPVARPAALAVAAAPGGVAVPPPLVAAAAPSAAVGSGPCKFHPKTQGRYYCKQCQHFFCELCVTSRAVGAVQHKFCRHCGTECVPVQVQIQQMVSSEKGFFARLPGAFAYPLRGSGLIMLSFGTLIFALINWFTGGTRYGIIPTLFTWWSLTAQVFSLGYLFAYLQSIIHATATEEKELPPLPSVGDFWQDILLPCLQLLGLTLFCFAPAIAVSWFAVANEQQAAMVPAIVAAFLLGVVYFPMAFLAVAMLDSVLAANPLQVIPSIFKAPLEYLVAIILLGCVLAMRSLGDWVIPIIFPLGLTTHKMGKLFAYLGASAFWGLVSLYLLVVGMHILGLVYVSKKDKLGWLNR